MYLKWSGSGYYRGTSEQHYRCYLPVLAGFMCSRLHGGRSLILKPGLLTSRKLSQYSTKVVFN